jgi:carbonic anhydrase
MEGIDPISEFVSHNAEYVARHGFRQLPTEPQKRLAILTCMDSRLDLFGALGLDLGEAHIIRNAGGLDTDDVVRSLILSQRKLGTREIMVIQHTRCGLEGLDEDSLRDELTIDNKQISTREFGSFQNVYANVRLTAQRLNAEPELRHEGLRGFVFDVDTGQIVEVDLSNS